RTYELEDAWRLQEELQWGHGSVAVENPRASAEAVVPERHFNGATARSPWRTPVERSATPPQRALQWGHGSVAVENVKFGPALIALGMRLQWGHGSVAVENPTASRSGSSSPANFNGATARSPWRTSAVSVCNPTSANFNGATARSPWRTCWCR